PDAGGRIFFNDADVTAVPIEQRNVGMVFQSYALFPNMNVAQNIAYGLKFRGASAQERTARVTELVALTGIEGLEHRRIDQLSGGQGPLGVPAAPRVDPRVGGPGAAGGPGARGRRAPRRAAARGAAHRARRGAARAA